VVTRLKSARSDDHRRAGDQRACAPAGERLTTVTLPPSAESRSPAAVLPAPADPPPPSSRIRRGRKAGVRGAPALTPASRAIPKAALSRHLLPQVDGALHGARARRRGSSRNWWTRSGFTGATEDRMPGPAILYSTGKNGKHFDPVTGTATGARGAVRHYVRATAQSLGISAVQRRDSVVMNPGTRREAHIMFVRGCNRSLTPS
jgi:hypothetical protein